MDKPGIHKPNRIGIIRAALYVGGAHALVDLVFFLVGVSSDSLPDLYTQFGYFAPVLIPVVGLIGTYLLIPRVSRTGWGGVLAGTLIWFVSEAVALVGWAADDATIKNWGSAIIVAAYPAFIWAIVRLPHWRYTRYGRLRNLIDVLVGTISAAVVVWHFILRDLLVEALGRGGWDEISQLIYIFGSIVYIGSALVLLSRRSNRQTNGHLYGLAGMFAAAATGQLGWSAYLLLGATTGELVSEISSRLVLISGAVMTWFLLKPESVRKPADTELAVTRWWHLIVPYSLVFALMVGQLWDPASGRFGLGGYSYTQYATFLVAFLIMARQFLAYREYGEVVDRQKGDLVASVSHELRTPLAAASGFASLLRDGWDDFDAEEREGMLRTVNEQIDYLTRLVADLVEVSRDSLHAMRLHKRPTNINDIARDAVALAGRHAEAVSLELGADTTFEVDPQRVAQIIVVLLTNASRYGGGKTLLAVEPRADVVRISVEDDGEGVPKQYEDIIWEKFERGANRLNSRTPGSGIGLPIARSLTGAHGGRIWYQRSERMGGSAFVLELPLRLA